jgi:drug/metabolite transporter (DMT)-like permease
MGASKLTHRARVAAATGLALVGFAANSLLCRGALGARRIDAASFTAVRLVSGAVVLIALARPAGGARGGSLASAAALFAYAAAFSFAYLSLPAGVGALLLFGAVQVTMIGGALRAGERPSWNVWSGLLLAFGGLAFLTLPGTRAPSILGSALMISAGAAWGVYSLRGRRSGPPLCATADNFLRSAPLALVLWAAAALLGGRVHVTLAGAILAASSGAVASGLGYSLWYAALPHLPAARAAVLQLSVPVLAAAGGMLLLGEVLTFRIVVCGAAILAGVALAARRASPAPQKAAIAVAMPGSPPRGAP